MINKKRLIKLTQKLIQINSENPPGREVYIARFIKDYLNGFGLRAKFYEFAKYRTNVVALLGDRGTHESLLLSPHLDTVPAGRNWRFDPFGGKIHKGRIYGRGATDCKGNLASCIEVLNSLVEEGVKLDYKIIFAATADEETGSGLGLIRLLSRKILRPDFAVILDSDSFNVVVAQKGLIHFKVAIFGKKAHGAYPWKGKNAIEIASRVIQRLKKYKFHLIHRPSLLKPPTVNIGTIKGGDKVNIVADWCEFEVDLRFLPGMTANKILKQIRKVIRTETDNFQVKTDNIQKPYQISTDHKLARSLLRAMQQVKKNANLEGSEGATVITFFQDLNIPAVACGFGKEGRSHVSDEYVRINDLYNGAKALEEFLKKWKN